MTAHPRDELETMIAENKELKATIREKRLRFALTDAGFEPDTGAGKAIAKMLPDDMELTPENITEYARSEFGFEPAPPEEAEVEAPAWSPSDIFDTLTFGAMPQHDLSVQDKLKKAEAEGDWATHDRINAQLLQQARHNS